MRSAGAWVLAGTLVAVSAAGPHGAVAGEQAVSLRAVARKTMEAYRDAVVTVKASIKMKGGFGGGDQEMEVGGTVIDPSGLTVVSESGLDPLAMMAGMFGGGEDNPLSGIQVDVGDVKIVLADGKEVPARLVLRDKDLDLAFVFPEEKGMKLPCVAMEKGPAKEVLDDIIVLGRLGRNLDRAPAVTLTRISAVVKKPRTFYACDSAGTMLDVGSPAFDEAGKPVGLLLKRRGPGGGHGLQDLISGMMPVILPCEDIAEVAKQASAEAAKPPAKKEDAAPAEGGGKKGEEGAGKGEGGKEEGGKEEGGKGEGGKGDGGMGEGEKDKK